MGKCTNCGGTGKLLLMKSWFLNDGYRRERCGICAGSGESSYRVPAEEARHQKECRERVKLWGGLVPPPQAAD